MRSPQSAQALLLMQEQTRTLQDPQPTRGDKTRDALRRSFLRQLPDEPKRGSAGDASTGKRDKQREAVTFVQLADGDEEK